MDVFFQLFVFSQILLKFSISQSIKDLFFPLFGHSSRHGTAFELLDKAFEVKIELFESIHL
jgi:hypothetical protein